MAVMIYAAHPIDSVDPGRYKKKLKDLRVNLELCGTPTIMFTPSRAWNLQAIREDTDVDPRLQHGNQRLLWMADIVVALLKEADGSVGLGREVQEAVDMGKWVIVQWDGKHWSLGDLLEDHEKVIVTTSDLDAHWWKDFFKHFYFINAGEQLREETASIVESLAAAELALGVAMRPSVPPLVGEGGDPAWEIRWTGDGQEPSRAHAGDAGFDLVYSGDAPLTIVPGTIRQIPAKIHMNWPNDPPVWGLLMGRSSSNRKNLIVYPSVIDTGYTGDLFAVVHNLNEVTPHTIQPGDRIAQIIPLPNLAAGLPLRRVESVDDFDTPDNRGEAGFGSSGS